MTYLGRITMALGLALAACSGGAKGKIKGGGEVGSGEGVTATTTEMTEQGKNAPPPPDVTESVKVEREVTMEATAQFKDAVKFFMDQEEVAAGRVGGAWEKTQCTQSADKFLAIAKAHDKIIEAYFNAGVSYQKCGMAKEAEDMYQKALKINPGHPPTLANLGEIYFRAGNAKVAKDYFQKAVDLDNKLEVASARSNLAWLLYLELRDPSKDAKAKKQTEADAIGHIQRALAVDNDSVEAYTLLALIYMEGSDKNKNRLDVASLLLREATFCAEPKKEMKTEEKKPDKKKDKKKKGKKGEEEKKAEEPKKEAAPEEPAVAAPCARKKNERYAPLWNAKGLLAMKRNDVPTAVQHFDRALKENPNFLEARLNIAQIKLSFRKYDEAEKDFAKALETEPENYDAIIGRGVALRGLEKIDDAEAQYNAAIKLQPDRADAYYNLGVLYKDFKTPPPNEIPDYEKNKESYKKAKEYFVNFQKKVEKKSDKYAEAELQIADCDTYAGIIDETIAQLKEIEAIKAEEAKNAANTPPSAPTIGSKCEADADCQDPALICVPDTKMCDLKP